jgi:hypothetical protein
MRTSLNEIKKIEGYLLGQLHEEESLLLDAQLLLDPDLREKLHWQKRTFDLLKLYGRQKLRAELEAVHHQVMSSNQGFRNKILSFFKKSE